MRGITKLLVAFGIGSAFGSAAFADPYTDAGDAYQRGDKAEYVRLMRVAAESGHVKAQFTLGYLYLQGINVVPDKPEGIRWLKRAAAQSDGMAQFILGDIYRVGDGVPVDDAEALRWYRLSAAAPRHPKSGEATFMAEAMAAQIDLNRKR